MTASVGGTLQNCTLDFGVRLGVFEVQPFPDLAERLKRLREWTASRNPDAWTCEPNVHVPEDHVRHTWRFPTNLHTHELRSPTRPGFGGQEWEEWMRFAMGILSYVNQRSVRPGDLWYLGPIRWGSDHPRMIGPSRVQDFCDRAADAFIHGTAPVPSMDGAPTKRRVILDFLEHHVRSYDAVREFPMRFFWAWTAFDRMVRFLEREWSITPPDKRKREFLDAAFAVMEKAGMFIVDQKARDRLGALYQEGRNPFMHEGVYSGGTLFVPGRRGDYAQNVIEAENLVVRLIPAALGFGNEYVKSDWRRWEHDTFGLHPYAVPL